MAFLRASLASCSLMAIGDTGIQLAQIYLQSSGSTTAPDSAASAEAKDRPRGQPAATAVPPPPPHPPLSTPPYVVALGSTGLELPPRILAELPPSLAGLLPDGFDGARTLRFATLGAVLHGPFFFYGFRQLDRIYGPAKTLAVAAKKAATGHLTLFPVFVTTFFTGMCMLERRSPESIEHKMSEVVPRTLMLGTLFWPAANMINFTLVPLKYRFVALNMFGIFWNSVLSVINSSAAAPLSVHAAAEASALVNTPVA
ncbi:hypothetical protein CAOG_06842 [Capsaspora owczarzaki ATCC 30864]|uniref:Uncharacterized protein n=1 Tax=Capsaspora owczarzaki (strain ATCC 30864) TaxID=595528 RepID=A0A0D2X4R8_CAPO3|nr:hypothetical protein CAOG_06842 [Capsaspora owczarzaki ATCC 30864]KJE96534.1 hypothetical protein CAOG_006842 [Capsaspora owczarzaki ATCC 30864]|eukprot:XP_004344463.2 hypothetical protein CAOG_06842 [Capsaspora owczarzaki ATCC 30864]